MAQQEEMQDRYQKLKQTRDELKLKLNLGKLEAKQAWEDVEDRFEKLEGKLKVLRAQGEDEADKVRQDVNVLIGDIKKGFEKLRGQAKN